MMNCCVALGPIILTGMAQPHTIPHRCGSWRSDRLAGSRRKLKQCAGLIISQMTRAHGSVLVAFAERLASRAVRENKPEFIGAGLSALAIAIKLLDFREVLPIVSLLHRSAEKLGLDPSRAVLADRRLQGCRSREVFGYVYCTTRRGAIYCEHGFCRERRLGWLSL